MSKSFPLASEGAVRIIASDLVGLAARADIPEDVGDSAKTAFVALVTDPTNRKTQFLAAATLRAMRDAIGEGPAKFTTHKPSRVPPGATLANSAAHIVSDANFKDLRAQFPEAMVVKLHEDFDAGIFRATSQGFKENVPGRTTNAKAPEGFTYVMMEKWGDNGGSMSLRPNTIITKADRGPPPTHPEATFRYVEAARNDNWVCYALRSPGLADHIHAGW